MLRKQQSSCCGSKGRGRNNINLRANIGGLEVKILEIVEFSTDLLLFPRSPEGLFSFFPVFELLHKSISVIFVV